MLVEVSKEEYRKYFPTDPSPYVSENFLNLNEEKQDKLIRLMMKGDTSMGLIVGVKDGIVCSPFSAPFGGFHYSHEYMNYEQVYAFLSDLKEWVAGKGYTEILITLPPDIYQVNMNAKLISSFIRLGYVMETPDLCNWMDLKKFNGEWNKKVVSQNCRKAVNNGLQWSVVNSIEEMQEAYKVIHRNREGLGRKIYMTLDDILKVNEVMPVDFFSIREATGECVGASVMYRGHPSIVQGIFMGGDLEKRKLGVIDYMYLRIFDYYKELGYHYIDMGTSSLKGDPNIGLIRFKEVHNTDTSLRYTFTWSP